MPEMLVPESSHDRSCSKESPKKLPSTITISESAPRPPYPCMGMIFGTRAQPRVMSSQFSDEFRKMDPCRTAACMGPFWVNGAMLDAVLHGSFSFWDSVWCSLVETFCRKNRSLVFCNLKQCFLHSTRTIFNGTRLDKRGLKSWCEKIQYGTKLVARQFKNSN